MGLNHSFYTSTLAQTSAGYYIIGSCPSNPQVQDFAGATPRFFSHSYCQSSHSLHTMLARSCFAYITFRLTLE